VKKKVSEASQSEKYDLFCLLSFEAKNWKQQEAKKL
jgi:hypothetical protein